MTDRVWRFIAYAALVLGTGALLVGLLAWAALGHFARGPQLVLLWGVALIVVFVVLEFETLGRVIATRGLQGGANIALRALALAGIVVLLNLLASQHSFKRDLTALRVNTLAPQTLKVLHALAEPVTVEAFYRPSSPGLADARRLLDSYRRENREKFRVGIVDGDKFREGTIDPDERPDLAFREGATEGTIIFRYANHPVERVQSAQEQDFTSALIKLTSTQSVKVYFLTGHGESVSGGGSGMTLARGTLEQEGFAVGDLSLLGDQPSVPADASAVVIAGAKQPLGDPELQALSAYADRGGRLMVMNAPLETSNLSRIIEPFGLSFEKAVVAEPTRHASVSVYAPATANYPFGPITKDLTNQNTFMVNAGPVAKRDVKEITQTSVWDTTADAYAIADSNLNRGFSPGRDKKGPFSLMMSAERKASPGPRASPSPSPSPAPPTTRIIAAGSWEFASDRVIISGANGALFLNAVNWLVGQEQLISIPPRQGRTATVALDSTQRTVVLLGTIVLLPALILLAGVAVWARRALRP